MPDDLANVIARVTAHATASMADTALLLGRSLNRCYQDVRERGTVAGIPVIRLSEKSVRLPSRPLLRLCGLLEDDAREDAEREQP